MFGPARWRQEVGIRVAEAWRGSVVLKWVSKLGGGVIMTSFVSEGKDFGLDPSWDRKPAEVFVNLWVSGPAAE